MEVSPFPKVIHGSNLQKYIFNLWLDIKLKSLLIALISTGVCIFLALGLSLSIAYSRLNTQKIVNDYIIPDGMIDAIYSILPEPDA